MIEVKAISGRKEYGEIPPEQLPMKASSDASANNKTFVETVDLGEGGTSSRQKLKRQYKNK